MPGTFTQNPEDAGMFYQWNSKVAFIGTFNNSSTATTWEKINDPSPKGWRLPSKAEVEKLLNAPNKWTTVNGVEGRIFGTAPNTIFLPAAGCPIGSDDVEIDGVGEYGVYWTSTGYGNDETYIFAFEEDFADLAPEGKSDAFSIRPVINQ